MYMIIDLNTRKTVSTTPSNKVARALERKLIKEGKKVGVLHHSMMEYLDELYPEQYKPGFRGGF